MTARGLRKILRSLRKFDTTEIDTVAWLIDIRDAIGFNPNVAPAITPRQQEVIRVHLIEDRSKDEAATRLGIRPRTMLQIEQDAFGAILRALQGEKSARRNRGWLPWQIALLYDKKLSLKELATKIGKSELAVKIMMSRLRKQNENVPYRRRLSECVTSSARTE